MTKEMKEVVLTEREEEMVKWLARNAYGTIQADFWEDGKQQFFSSNMTVALMLSQYNKANAMYFICMLLEQGYSSDLAELMTLICKPGDGSMDLFMDELKECIICDMFAEEEDDYDDEETSNEKSCDEGAELYDVNFNSELDENPFAVIRVEVDNEKCPEFESKLREILQVLGIKLPVFRKKECEEDE